MESDKLSVVAVCGIPGSGKTTFCEWLEREKGFLHFDFDQLLCADLKQACAWYGNIRPALGERFAMSVEASVEAIEENPLQFPVVYRGRRRAGVRRFPYGIIFEVQEHRVVVLACFHGKRDPRQWQAR